MKTAEHTGIGFAIDSNVHIEIVSPQNIITQTLDKHNKATKHMVSGIMRFLRGEFNTSYRRTNKSQIIDIDKAKDYIPCYINFGTGGIVLDNIVDDNGTEYTLPKYDSVSRRTPTLSSEWQKSDNIVKFTDTTLSKEVNIPRYEIGVLDSEELDTDVVSVGDTEQIIFYTEISPKRYTDIIYDKPTDIFITEIGLFSGPVPYTEDLLAKVILTDPSQVLYVRPQDTIILTWVISIIALDDWSRTINYNGSIGENVDNTLNFVGTVSYDNSINNENVDKDE